MKMNNVLELKGRFQSRENTSKPGPLNLPKGQIVTIAHLEDLKRQLFNILKFWEENHKRIGGALVSVHYKQVVAKSNRAKTLLSEGSKSPNESIRGAKFVWDSANENTDSKQKHIFTHFVSLGAIENSITKLDATIKTIKELFGDEITSEDLERANNGSFKDKYIKISNFSKTIVDANFIERFDIDVDLNEIREDSIITLYKTGIDTRSLLEKIGIDVINTQMLDETTIRLTPNEIKLVQTNYPYLISMNVKDFSEVTRENIIPMDLSKTYTIPKPQLEPTVGVIDTQFDESVYFHEWVEYKNELDKSIDIKIDDMMHGTAVTSIIVDGPTFNPHLEDGCGRFKVRHFGVAIAGKFSSFTILKLIKNIVAENTDIKVWNLSLGSDMEINANFISVEAAELDKIQSEYNVIFVVAGTNKPQNKSNGYKIGAPADSLNSLVVNSVDFSGNSASYTRVGPVLSFFHKPDVSYYGGDGPDKIIVCEPLGAGYVTGTSYAAPWITRKVAYLMYVVGLSREVAKALIIDSAAAWDRKDDDSFSIGFGIVPKKINDILFSADDEIRFIMTGSIDEYETYTYSIPVPQEMNAHPYFAKATLAYFPTSDRNQGVDYTSTEMDIHFGRITEKQGKAVIKSINCNKQADQGIISIYEESARKEFRKWDNTKHISELLSPKAKPRKAYESGMWGLSIKTKERLSPKEGIGLQFGVVVTLKEMNGVNRIDEFIKMCILKGWFVNKIEISNKVDIYLKAEEEIELS